jgi:hypothetical protein
MNMVASLAGSIFRNMFTKPINVNNETAEAGMSHNNG